MPFLMKLSLLISYSLLSAIAFAGTDHSHEHKHQHEHNAHCNNPKHCLLLLGQAARQNQQRLIYMNY